MSTPTLPAGAAGVIERAAALLVDGGHCADGDDVRAAFTRIDDGVKGRLRAGAPSVDAAVSAVAQATCDRLATRLLQNRPLGGPLHDVAVLHAVLDRPLAHWFEISVLDAVVAQ